MRNKKTSAAWHRGFSAPNSNAAGNNADMARTVRTARTLIIADLPETKYLSRGLRPKSVSSTGTIGAYRLIASHSWLAFGFKPSARRYSTKRKHIRFFGTKFTWLYYILPLAHQISGPSFTMTRATDASQEETVFLFGGHVLSQSKQSLDNLIRHLMDGPNANWIADTVADLPRYWDALNSKIPVVAGAVPGPRLLAELNSWLREGLESHNLQEDEELPNIVVGPLMVAIQLNQYWRYLEFQKLNGLAGDVDLQAEVVFHHTQKQLGSRKVKTLGFCAGLIGALAVSSSSNRSDFEKYGAVAVRMGMLIGAIIDAGEKWDRDLGKGGSMSYATAWRGPKQAEDMDRIISDLWPDTYTAVRFDEARSTVTTSERTAPTLVRRLRAAGITAFDVGIKGRIHSPGEERKRHTDALVALCNEMQGLQFADGAALVLPTYNNQAEPVLGGNMVELALRSILTQQCNWYGTVLKAAASKDDSQVVAFGLDRCIPPSLTRRLGKRQVHFEDIEKVQSIDKAQNITTHDPRPTVSGTDAQDSVKYGADTIAVVGMSVKVAGADDLDEFSAMLKTGQSQHQLITRERLMHDYLFRESADADPKRKFYGNFMRNSDAFDHKFFKKSPRESQAMDPQCRLSLQAAYQAIEQSGYFSETTESTQERDKMHAGVYIGSCGVDYEHNITCHAPNAFTATGGLKSFIVGRLSHYFGWTGPSMTFDTACSSSAVAIHQACRDLLSGECTSALCGGVNIMTNMLWLQNLAAGSFLSPTGQCKPFDEGADGYCRAEGLAFVYLKKMSDAVADGNPIMATIPATMVYQNQNCTPLFVPNSPSLSQLFKDVIRKADVAPRDISLVEAHGTGTAVGDPAEYESVRLALGGPIRDKKLPLGSVKGHVGHTEGASGVIALVKTIMMMRDGFIPPQASFTRLNPHIEVRPDDMMEVVTSLQAWENRHKVALINNYGACGSNASMVVAQAPSVPAREARNSPGEVGSSRFPFCISGLDARSIAAYSAKLVSYLNSRAKDEKASLADMSFNLARQSNRNLPQSLIFGCASVAELQEKLSEAASATSADNTSMKPERPVILCFGGQVSKSVGLDRKLYDRVAILRRHLHECDAVIMSMGLDSIFPGIFARESMADTVKLQTTLFAMQYSCARCWMDCGLQKKVVAAMGHSFGEITALCLSGVLSLRDTVKLVAGRAKLVQDTWGPDPGAMVAVEADEALVNDLVQESNRSCDGSAGIACYNGPRSFTLAGSTKSMEAITEVLASNPKFSGIKSKRLAVTNAFHSPLVDRLDHGLGELGKELMFSKPGIQLERATESRFDADMDWTFVQSHMRQPVYFNHAIQRLSQQHPQAIFLEAGSSSTITVMAGRALAQTLTSDAHHFQAMSITGDKGLDGLTDATAALWKQGLRVSFWPHHAEQAQEYTQLLLPPYQFDTAGRHWLDMKSPAGIIEKAGEAIAAARGSGTAGAAAQQQSHQDPKTLGLWSFVGYQDKKGKKPRFRINTASDSYQSFFSGHVIAQTAPICPATLESDMVIEAIFSLHPDWKANGSLPIVNDLVNHSPICADDTRVFYIDYAPLDDAEARWAVMILSVDASTAKDAQKHVELRLHIRDAADPEYIQEFGRYERLVCHTRCKALLGLDLGDDSVDALQGRSVYQAFSDVVDYPPLYRGVRCVVGRGTESAGVVHKRHQGKSWLDVPLSDSFSQVGGMWVNLMTDVPEDEMYIATGCEKSMRSPRMMTPTFGTEHGPSVWHVLAQHTRQSEKAFTTDLFVFDAETGALAEAMLGVQYGRVAKASMSKMLTRLTKDKSVLRTPASSFNSATAGKADIPTTAVTARDSPVDIAEYSEPVDDPSKEKRGASKKTKSSGRSDITDEVRNLVANVSGIDPNEMTLDSEMADLGIDSLMGMELGREVEIVFKCRLDQTEQMEATTLRKFVACISNALKNAGNGDEGQDDDEDSSTAEESSFESTDCDDNSPISTPDSAEDNSALDKSAIAASLVAEGCAARNNMALLRSDILDCFSEVKLQTDGKIREHHLDDTDKIFIAGSNRLCAALVVEAMEELGMPLRTAAPGESLERPPFQPQQTHLMNCVYAFLERDARLIDRDVTSGRLTRTHVAAPRKTSEAVLQELLVSQPGFAVPNRLTHYAVKRLAGVLSGATDGIRVIFGTPEARELVADMYCKHTFNRMNYLQMQDVIGRLAARVKEEQPGKTLKVLEMGAGTGGTTMVIVPFLASLGVPVEFTFTDLSPSMVANARRKFGKEYPFMRFAVHDIEKPPAEELKGQHIVLASNAIHATRNLVVSGSNVHQALRPDGFLMMLEMTEVVPFIDLVFGLLEGWWLFDDGRNHAVVPAEHWERELHAAGFGHVDWTDGELVENSLQKVIMALASGPPEATRLPKLALEQKEQNTEVKILDRGDMVAREAEAERLVAKYTEGWATQELDTCPVPGTRANPEYADAVVLVTGATGSLGSHLVQQFAENRQVSTVVCLNRPTSQPVDQRQADAFSSRGIQLSPEATKKLRVLATNSSQPQLGLPSEEYEWLVQHGTHIVHNAWPMSGTRSLSAFEPQLQAFRNLLDLAQAMATHDAGNKNRIGFQFVSSIGVVGFAGVPSVPEQRVPMSAVLPGGYTEGKWACERMLDETLHRYPKLFRPMVVRPGQIAGSTTSGVWNPVEHFAFLVKSAQALRAWPDLDGVLQWLPVDRGARVMAELLRIGDVDVEAHAIYHIDNPVGQPWKSMSPVLAAALDIPPQAIISFEDWIQRVRRSPLLVESENPAARLVDFLEEHFRRMSCGGLVLDTQHAQEHSHTMAHEGPVSAEVARRYVAAWKDMGFLNH